MSRLHRWLPWTLVVGSAMLCGAALVLVRVDAASDASLLVVNTVVAVAYPAVGAVILARHPRHRVGWLLLLPVSLALVTFAAAYASRSGSTWFAWATLWAWVPGIVALPMLLLLLFPDGRLPSPRWRPVLWAVLGTAGAVMAWAALAPGPNPNFPAVRNPLGWPGLPSLDGGTLLAVGVVVVVLLVVCLAALLLRFRAATGVERAQLAWFLLAGAVVVLGQVALLVLPEGAGTVVEIATSLAVPAAVAVAILRYRLYDIAVVVDRLLYGDRADPYALLALLGERLQNTRIAAEVLPTVTEAIAGALRLPYVAVELVTDGAVTHSTAHGRRGRCAGASADLPVRDARQTPRGPGAGCRVRRGGAAAARGRRPAGRRGGLGRAAQQRAAAVPRTAGVDPRGGTTPTAPRPPRRYRRSPVGASGSPSTRSG